MSISDIIIYQHEYTNTWAWVPVVGSVVCCEKRSFVRKWMIIPSERSSLVSWSNILKRIENSNWAMYTSLIDAVRMGNLSD